MVLIFDKQMLESRKFRAKWVGRETSFSAWMSYDNEGNYYIRVPKKIGHKWVVWYRDIKDKMQDYVKKKLFDPDYGVTNEFVYIYYYDFHTMEPFKPMMDNDSQLIKENLRIERDILRKQLTSMKRMINEGADLNHLQEFMKKENYFHSKVLKPPMFSKEMLDKKDDKKK